MGILFLPEGLCSVQCIKACLSLMSFDFIILDLLLVYFWFVSKLM